MMALTISLLVMCAASIGLGWCAQGLVAAIALRRARAALDQAETLAEFDKALAWWIKATRKTGWSR